MYNENEPVKMWKFAYFEGIHLRKFFFETHTIKQFSSLIYRFENEENTESAEIEDDYYYYCESGIETLLLVGNVS